MVSSNSKQLTYSILQGEYADAALMGAVTSFVEAAQQKRVDSRGVLSTVVVNSSGKATPPQHSTVRQSSDLRDHAVYVGDSWLLHVVVPLKKSNSKWQRRSSVSPLSSTPGLKTPAGASDSGGGSGGSHKGDWQKVLEVTRAGWVNKQYDIHSNEGNIVRWHTNKICENKGWRRLATGGLRLCAGTPGTAAAAAAAVVAVASRRALRSTRTSATCHPHHPPRDLLRAPAQKKCHKRSKKWN